MLIVNQNHHLWNVTIWISVPGSTNIELVVGDRIRSWSIFLVIDDPAKYIEKDENKHESKQKQYI